MNETKREKLWTRSFLLIWQGQFVSTLGDAAYSVALGFWVLKVTGSTALMGTLMAASTLPGVLLSPFAGVWIDRLSRKPLLIAMDILRGIAMALVAAAAFTQIIQVWMVFAAGVLLSLCGAVFRPGVNSVLPDTVPVSKLTNANSLLSIAGTASNMFGNVAGGFLYQLLGAPLLFLFNGISYFFSGASLGFVRIPQRRTAEKKHFLHDMGDGFRYMWEERGLRYILIIAAISNFLSFIAIVDLLPFFERSAELGAGRYGIAMACFMGGAMLGYLLLGIKAVPAKRKLLLFIASNAVSGISLVVSINMQVFGLMLVFITVGGFFNAFVNVILMSTVQAMTPNHLRGKVLAFLSMITQSLTPFAMALGGVLAGVLPIRLIISVCFGMSVVIITPFYFVKAFERFVSFDGSAPPDAQALSKTDAP